MSERQVKVRYTPEGGQWIAEVVEEPRIHTQGRTLSSAEERIREAIALWYELEDDQVVLESHVELDDATTNMIIKVRRQRQEAQEAEQESLRSCAELAERLVMHKGLSLRDAGQLIGISHQRVQQLVSGRRP